MSTTDAIIVGSGLAGLSAALTILDAGGNVIVIEKEAKMGGNSIKASSGINACPTPADEEAFQQDTLKSAGGDKNRRAPHHVALVSTLVKESAGAVGGWLQQRLEVDLSQVAQLGGHSAPRTHRPGGKMPVGAEIMIKLQTAVKAFEEKGTVQILTSSKVVKLLQNDQGQVIGVAYKKITEETNGDAEQVQEISANHVVLATGGFAADRSPTSWLAKYRPELLTLGATAGEFSTGDGLTLAQSANAGLVDMDQIQVHPTGFIDPKDPDNPNKFLAAEILRGVGGILLDPQGKRFCNEIGRRDYITDKVLSLNEEYAKTKQWNADQPAPQIYLLLSEEGANAILKHIEFYAWKGFLVKVTGIEAVAEYMGVPQGVIQSTLEDYQQVAAKGEDTFGKTRFVAVPKTTDDAVLYVGKVTPVLHYCMGGVTIDPRGRVLDESGNPIPNLHACGEVAGGLHGENRLAGNSLCECVVFGRIVAQSILDAKT